MNPYPSKKEKLIYLSKMIIIYIGSVVFSSSIFANPVLDHVAAGNVSIEQAPNSTVINQASQKAIINWHSFNIGAQEATHFNQPNGGVALNRISPTQGASQIYGKLSATGQIILVNPAGVYISPSAFINVGGIIATTAGITDANFLNGNYKFDQVSPYSGSIINQGQIIAANHGLVALVGNSVQNDGTIQANMGKVVLASGETFTMSFSGNTMIGFAIDKNTMQRGIDQHGNPLPDGVKNSGIILADGGSVLVTAKTAANVLDHVINMDGIIQAQSVNQINGEIVLSGSDESGVVRIAGKLNASGKSPNEKGGTVKVTGHNILLTNSADIDVSGDTSGGNIYIGGNYQGKGPLPNANA
ncbi:MAG: hypothetical protein ACD_46C00641G0002, partial [uncultured bacterium]